MRACGIFVLICVAVGLTQTTSAAGPCEKIENTDWHAFATLKTCRLDSTAINSKDFSITSDRDVTVEGFEAWYNKNLEYLPNNLGAKFPNMLALQSYSCSIKEISRHNFEGVSKLRYLSLSGNKIEQIDDDTFEYIPAVEMIYLTRNKIKKLSGRAFATLHKLTRLELHDNVCIDDWFITPARIADMSRVVTEKCGIIDLEPSSMKIAKLEADLMAQSEELQALKLENVKLRIEKAEADLQIAHHNEIKDQLQARTAEISEKNEKIKQCEKKIQILGGDGSF